MQYGILFLIYISSEFFIILLIELSLNIKKNNKKDLFEVHDV